MFLNRQQQSRQLQQGSGLVIAIFILVVLLLLASVMIRLLSSGAQAVVYEVMGTRAYAAAQAGANRQMLLLFPANAPSQTCADIQSVAAPVVNSVSGLENCQIILPANSCQDFVHDTIRYYTITVTGQCSADGIVTERSIRIDARSID